MDKLIFVGIALIVVSLAVALSGFLSVNDSVIPVNTNVAKNNKEPSGEFSIPTRYAIQFDCVDVSDKVQVDSAELNFPSGKCEYHVGSVSLGIPYELFGIIGVESTYSGKISITKEYLLTDSCYPKIANVSPFGSVLGKSSDGLFSDGSKTYYCRGLAGT